MSSIEQLRTVNHVNIVVDPPTFLTTTHWVWALKPDGFTEFRQHLNTEDAGTTTGPINVLASIDVGAWLFRFQSMINTTNCNLLPNVSELHEHKVYVTNCRPEWWNIGVAPNQKTPHVPSRSVRIYLNPYLWDSLATAATDAATSWNENLAEIAVRFTVVPYDCSTEPDCIVVQEAPVSQGCASFDPGGLASDGTTTGVPPPVISLPPGWTDRSAERKQRTMAHELGHALGLNENSTCNMIDSVMAPSTDPLCLSTQGMRIVPSDHDAGQARSTYGNNVRKVCGFQ
jgi:hypothetical protein